MENLNEHINKDLVSYCGLYCGACKKYIKKECDGCKSVNKETPKWCKVRPCNQEKEIGSCAECKDYLDVKKCNKLYPLSYKFGEFITQMSRKEAIEMIKSKGYEEFAEFMMKVNKSLCLKKRNVKYIK